MHEEHETSNEENQENQDEPLGFNNGDLDEPLISNNISVNILCIHDL